MDPAASLKMDGARPRIEGRSRPIEKPPIVCIRPCFITRPPSATVPFVTLT
jgi:hypothetical protein